MLAAAFLWLAAASVGVAAGKVTSFTAEQVLIGGGGKVEHQNKIYAAGQKFRVDGFMPQSGAELVVIIRQDLKKQWMLNLQKKTYFERALEEKDLEQLAGAMVNGRTEKVLGEEKVSGYACTKKEIEVDIEIMGTKRKSRSVVWQSDRFDLPLRTQHEGGQIMEVRHIKEGAPAAELFEVPGGFHPVADMMELMGMPAKLPPGFKAPAPKK
jgi:hypothetical protein